MPQGRSSGKLGPRDRALRGLVQQPPLVYSVSALAEWVLGVTFIALVIASSV
jgi:hypothetical protein